MTRRKIKVNDAQEGGEAVKSGYAEHFEAPSGEAGAVSSAEREEVTTEEIVAAEEGVLSPEDELNVELEQLKEEARESHDKMLRMAAELENFKKRMLREKEISLKFAEENILRELLPSIDNLERAMEQGSNTNDASTLLEGVEMTLKGLMSTLGKFGLRQINGVGEPFDPNFHEALATEASKDIPENTILQEYEKGYLYKERLLRAAKVVVSKGDV